MSQSGGNNFKEKGGGKCPNVKSKDSEARTEQNRYGKDKGKYESQTSGAEKNLFNRVFGVNSFVRVKDGRRGKGKAKTQSQR